VGFFLDDVKSGIGLGLFWSYYWALGLNVKAQWLFSKKLW